MDELEIILKILLELLNEKGLNICDHIQKVKMLLIPIIWMIPVPIKGNANDLLRSSGETYDVFVFSP